MTPATGNIFQRLTTPADGRWLAAYRIGLGFVIFLSAQRRLIPFLGNSDQPVIHAKVFLPVYLVDFVDAHLGFVRILLCILALLFSAGLFTRVVTPLLAIVHLVVYAFVYQNFDAPIPWFYEWPLLFILIWAKPAEHWSADALISKLRNKQTPVTYSLTYRWPLEAATAWFAMIYVWAAIAKFVPISDGLSWLDGGAIRHIMYIRYLDSPSCWLFGTPLFDYTGNLWAFTLLAVIAIVTEFSAILLLVTTRAHFLVIAAILGMHVFLVYIGVFGFLEHAVVLSIPVIGTMRYRKAKPSH